jgi:membrane protease YdiL (CAAX protease family)
MKALAVNHRVAGTGGQAAAGTAALALTLACAAALALFSADIAIGGDLLERAAVPLRMLVLVGLETVLLRWSGDRWSDVGLSRPGSMWRVGGLVIGGYLAVGVVAAIGHAALPAMGLAPKMSAIFAALRGDTAEYLYWLLPVAWGSAAIGEELVFRACLQTRLERFVGTRAGATAFAVIAQATIFGALHGYLGAAGAILAGCTGLVLGLVYILGGRNLWACIILHGLIDTVSLTAVYLGAFPAGPA